MTLDNNKTPGPGLPPYQNFPDRRKKERICTPFPALVEGVDIYGKSFKISTVLDNLSVDGLYLRMITRVGAGDHLSIVFNLSADSEDASEGQLVRVEGTVIRVEDKIGGACGVALMIEPARFL